MDKKLFKNTYKFICSSCGEFSHTNRDYCEVCGKQDTIHKASKKDYELYFEKKSE
jgi:rRNA maturation endonuclease Nob1